MAHLRVCALVLVVCSLVPFPALAQDSAVPRLQAEDPVGAALAWSQFGRVEGGADRVLLARDDRFADALSSGGVQGLLDAPLLLTPPDRLDSRVEAELDRLGAGEVVILGGPEAISEGVEQALVDSGRRVERVFGDSRLTTATALARRFFPSAGSVVLARAFGDALDETRAFADSLGAGVFAAQTGRPVLLTASDQLSAATEEHLAAHGVREVVVVGGLAAIGQGVRDRLSQLGLELREVYGPDRFSTAHTLALHAVNEGVSHVRPVFVPGEGDDVWAAGLAAPAHVSGMALWLTRRTGLTPDRTLNLLATGYPEPPVCGPLLTTAACDQAVAASTAVDLEASLVAALPVHDDGHWTTGAPVRLVQVRPTALPHALCFTVRNDWSGFRTITLARQTGETITDVGEGGCTTALDPALVDDIIARPAGYEIVVTRDEAPSLRGPLFAVDGVAHATLVGQGDDDPRFIPSSGHALLLGDRDDHSAVRMIIEGHFQEGTAREARLVGEAGELARWAVRNIEHSSMFLDALWVRGDPAVIRDIFSQPDAHTIEVHGTQRTLRGRLASGSGTNF